MGALEDFLETVVERYLFEDLATMRTAKPAGQDGACGYPTLASVFAGIELLGGLLSTTDPTFSRRLDAGRTYFREYWALMYPAEDRKPLADPLYSLARNGIAHVYLTKGRIWVYCDRPTLHLTIAANRSIHIDARQLGIDFERTYREVFLERVKLEGPRIESRLREMLRLYEEDAEKSLPMPPVGAPPSESLTFTHGGSGIDARLLKFTGAVTSFPEIKVWK